MTSIVNNLTDFESLLLIAKRHNLVELKVGDIHLILPPPPPEKEPVIFTNEPDRTADEVSADIYRTTINM